MALTIASFAAVCGQPVELVAVRAAQTVRQMLPKGFCCQFYFFGMQTKPAPQSSSIALFATRCGCVEAVLRSVVRILPVIGLAVIFWLLSVLVLSASRSIPRREASALSGMDTSAVDQMPRLAALTKQSPSAPLGVDTAG